MTFTYDVNNLGSNLAKVRLWIGDTDSSNQVFQDEEINSILSQSGGDVRLAAANCLRALASQKSRLSKMKKALNYSEDTRGLAKDLREQAKEIEEGGVEPWEGVSEQTFGPLQKPHEGAGERDHIDR